MTSDYFSSALALSAIDEFRSLGAVSLARSMGEPVASVVDFPALSVLMVPEDRLPKGVVRRAGRMNAAMPFTQCAAAGPLQYRVLASGLKHGLVERVIARLRKPPNPTSPDWIDATLNTALAAPDFLREAQITAYRGLRRRVFFAPGGPALDSLSVTTFLVLIQWCGRPSGLFPPAWARLGQVTADMVKKAGWQGPFDRLVLTQAREVLGQDGRDLPDRAAEMAVEHEKGVEDVPG